VPSSQLLGDRVFLNAHEGIALANAGGAQYPVLALQHTPRRLPRVKVPGAPSSVAVITVPDIVVGMARAVTTPSGDDLRGALEELGRYAGSATLVLSSLADGEKHGYALIQDVEAFAGVRLAPGTLYEALARLERQGLIEALTPVGRRRPYRLTSAGERVLRAHLASQRRVAEIGLGRLGARGAVA
jgi:DNA-binding PadR family transcriptional regulator